MDIEELVIEILRTEPNLRARDIAERISARDGQIVDKAGINSLLYGKLKEKVTQDKSYRWRLREDGQRAPEHRVPKSTATSSLGKLCKYYLDCLSQDDLEGVSVFAENRYGDPDYVALPNLPQLGTDGDSVFEGEEVKRLLNKVRRDKSRLALYLGYPLRMRFLEGRSGWKGFKVEPVFLFPITATSGTNIRLEEDLPRINFAALKGVAEIAGGKLLEEIVQLVEELGIGNAKEGIPEIDDLARRLQQVRPEWNWLEILEPENLVAIPRITELTRDGFYNRAVVLTAERSRYTQGLETELTNLSNLSDNEYEGTSLYRWLKKIENAPSPAQETLPLLEVLPLNEEQREAVRRSLSQPLTVITGPPGTGKSQVVTSLLLNAAWRGQKVLFASKNNKAVDVVEVRANALGVRPVVLRLGSNEVQARLAEYLSSLLSARCTSDDEARFNEAKVYYEKVLTKFASIERQMVDIIALRNLVDKSEQTIESYRTQFGCDLFNSFKKINVSPIEDQLVKFETLLAQCNRNKQPFLARLIWPLIKKDRFRIFVAALDTFRSAFGSLGLAVPSEDMNDYLVGKWVILAAESQERLSRAKQISAYFEALRKLGASKTLPDVSRDFIKATGELTEISEELWDHWVKLQPARLTRTDRELLQEYASVLKIIISANENNRSAGRHVFQKYYQLFPKISHMLPCWAVTSLSVRSKVPFERSFFDMVVIDEASQCDIPSALPLLYRAKRAVIIGDPKQLRHISSISKGQDIQLMEKHGTYEDYLGWAYSTNSLYDLAQGFCAPEDIINLRDHHRSHADIISFSNQHFYETSLRIATRYDQLKALDDGKPAVRWENVQGPVQRPSTGGAINEAEAKAIVRILRDLVGKNYTGSIGVVSPFRAQANRIRDLVYQDADLTSRLTTLEFLVDTVHRFQGDERDLMIFSPVISQGTPDGALIFLRNNGNLFNVAITRARSILIVVGDKSAALSSGVVYMKAFAEYVDSIGIAKHKREEETKEYGPEYPSVSRPETVSEWEKILYRALYRKGIKTMPQYTVDQYVLDLAYKGSSRKLDIEVDGEKYHRNWDGELCRRDQIRNRRLIELGWDVMRFWVYEIRDDLDSVVARVQSWVDVRGG